MIIYIYIYIYTHTHTHTYTHLCLQSMFHPFRESLYMYMLMYRHIFAVYCDFHL